MFGSTVTIVVSGGSLIVHVQVAGVGSAFCAASRARTLRTCVWPAARSV